MKVQSIILPRHSEAQRHLQIQPRQISMITIRGAKFQPLKVQITLGYTGQRLDNESGRRNKRDAGGKCVQI